MTKKTQMQVMNPLHDSDEEEDAGNPGSSSVAADSASPVFSSPKLTRRATVLKVDALGHAYETTDSPRAQDAQDTTVFGVTMPGQVRSVITKVSALRSHTRDGPYNEALATPSYTLHPEHPFLRLWTAWMSIILISIGVILPCQLIMTYPKDFHQGEISDFFPVTALFELSLLLDTIFKLRTGYYDFVEGVIVFDTLKIMKKVGPAFILDVISSMPFTIILALSGGTHRVFDPLSSNITFGGSFVNLLRCLRLIRVLYNGTNLGTGIYSFFMYIVPGAVSFYMVRILTMFSMFLILCHYIALIWFYLGMRFETVKREPNGFTLADTSVEYGQIPPSTNGTFRNITMLGVQSCVIRNQLPGMNVTVIPTNQQTEMGLDPDFGFLLINRGPYPPGTILTDEGHPFDPLHLTCRVSTQGKYEWDCVGNIGGCSGWMQKFSLDIAPLDEQYLASFYFVFTTITTVGYGDVSPTTFNEFIFVIVVQFIGAILLGYIVGVMGQTEVGLNVNDEMIHKRQDYMADLMTVMKVDPTIKRRVQDHYEFVQNHVETYCQDEILSTLPLFLRKDTACALFHRAVEYELFVGMKRDFVVEAVGYLRPAAARSDVILYEAGDQACELYILLHGKVNIHCNEGTLNTTRHDTTSHKNLLERRLELDPRECGDVVLSMAAHPSNKAEGSDPMFGLETILQGQVDYFKFAAVTGSAVKLYRLTKPDLVVLFEKYPDMRIKLQVLAHNRLRKWHEVAMQELNLSTQNTIPYEQFMSREMLQEIPGVTSPADLTRESTPRAGEASGGAANGLSEGLPDATQLAILESLQRIETRLAKLEHKVK